MIKTPATKNTFKKSSKLEDNTKQHQFEQRQSRSESNSPSASDFPDKMK
jgi:hypothetical protein